MDKIYIDLSGYISSVLFAICATPLAIEAIKKKRVELPNLYLVCWAFGEFFSVIYILNKDDVTPLYWNAAVSSINLSILLYYKFFPSKNDCLKN
jgi:hypothetical protein